MAGSPLVIEQTRDVALDAAFEFGAEQVANVEDAHPAASLPESGQDQISETMQKIGTRMGKDHFRA